MADLSSILGGMVQGFKDFGTGLVDMFGTGGAAIGDAIESIRTGRATNKNQDDFRKWLYQTDNTQDAAAKGLGTILNGVQTASDFIPGAGAVTRNPLFNGVQGAIGGVADEFKMAGKDYDLGRAAQRAGVGAASGLASAYTNQALGKTGNKLINNGLVRGAAGGALAGGIANAGYTGIEGGSVQDMINAGLYGAQTGALVGGTTGLARELIKPNHKMDVALTDDERRARIANIDDQLAKLDTSTQEGIDRHNELMMARIKYEQPQEYMMAHRPTRSGIYADDLLAEGEDGLSYPKDVYDKPQNYTFMYTDTPDVMNETMAQLNAVRGNPNGEVTIYRATPGDTINDGDWITLSESYAKHHNDTQLDGKGNVLSQKVNVRDIQPAMDDLAEWGYFPQKKAPKTVADLMAEPKQKTVADLMLSPEQEEFFKDSVIRDENGNLKPMYHGTRGDFTVFGDNAPQSTSNGHASVGHWFTPTEEGAQNFANSVWYGDGDPKVMKTYLNIKNPKIYETVDNSAAIEPLTKRLQELELNPSKLSDTELYHKNIYHASTVQNMINLADEETAIDWLTREKHYDKENAVKLVDEIANIKKLADEKKNLQNTISELRHSDAYQQFKTDIYKMDGQTADDANVGGVGMALRDKNSIKKYVDKLKSEGYDGIVIKGTMYDAEDMGGPNDQYVVFDSNQIKSVDNLRPTADPDIMYSKVTPGQSLEKTIAGSDAKINRIGSAEVAPIDTKTLPKSLQAAQEYLNEGNYINDIEKFTGKPYQKLTNQDFLEYSLYLKNPKDKEFYRTIIDDMVNDGTTTYEKYASSAARNKRLEKLMKSSFDDLDAESLGRFLANNRTKLNNGTIKDIDAELSDRLGIGRSNTLMRDNYLPPDALGAYDPTNGTISIDTNAPEENLVNTLAHERLHSFQTEGDFKRYDKRVTDAYEELSKDLKKHLKTPEETAKKYASDTDYWGNEREQQSRMLQQYLENKGFTKGGFQEANIGEWGNEINPAFDKFFGKLRALSKKGVALPAITALLGGGAIAGALTSGKDDKKKKSEVK